MASPEFCTAQLYEQVLEYAKREIDEAASKIEDLKRSIQLLEARVEAAKSVYESVAARLNLEDETEASYASAYEEPPKEVPEPPAARVETPAAPSEPAKDDLSLIRQHLAQKVDAEQGPNGSPPPPPAAATDEKDAFSMDLIGRHLAEKANAEASTDAIPSAPSAPPPAEETPASEAPSGTQSGLSDADRELIGAYLRSKQD